jgi:hypothetical protein
MTDMESGSLINTAGREREFLSGQRKAAFYVLRDFYGKYENK